MLNNKLKKGGLRPARDRRHKADSNEAEVGAHAEPGPKSFGQHAEVRQKGTFRKPRSSQHSIPMKTISAIQSVLYCPPLLLALCASDTLAATPDPAAAAKRVTQIVAHRGASAERPECTLESIKRAIETGATAVEVDVRTSKDGRLFILHDTTLDRTTNGSGNANDLPLVELQKLDAGSWFDSSYAHVRIPSLIEAARACQGRIDLLLDLKEQGDEYDRRVAETILSHGDHARTIVGVRSVDQARRFRSLLPKARQLALIPSVDSIEAFAEAGVDTIRLWPRWLKDGDAPAKRVRATGCKLHLNGTMGELGETWSLLALGPDSLSSDHPKRLRDSLARIARGDTPSVDLDALIESADGTQLVAGTSRVGARTFLNRDYTMSELPEELTGLPRQVFNGGDGGRVRMHFLKPTVMFAAFEYNQTGAWSFVDRRPPSDFGWHRWRKNAYRGSSNPGKANAENRATIWFREFKAGQELAGLPPWWLCLGVVELEAARKIEGFKAGLISHVPVAPPSHSHADVAARPRPLAAPRFDSKEAFLAWQAERRSRFVERMLYPYQGKVTIVPGKETQQSGHKRREYHASLDGRRLFRYFRLEPDKKPRATIVCFMGHGKAAQILDEPDSYQQACAAQFAKEGYLVYAMENIGMEPGQDTHLDLDQSLRLEGHGWYSLLFAHQRILLDQVFADPAVDPKRVGATGVSTGGLLTLSAAAMEPRISAASVQGIFGSMRVSFIRDRHRHCRCGAIPRLLPEFDLPELALLVSPRPLHVSNAQKDGFGPEEARRCIELITPYYLGMSGVRPEFSAPPGGHEFAFESAKKFFTNAFGIAVR